VRCVPAEPPKGLFQREPLPIPKEGGNPKLFAHDALTAAARANQKLAQAEAWSTEQSGICGGLK
jgi:hypothetical protein